MTLDIAEVNAVNLYRTIFCVTAKQGTSLSIGGSQDANSVTDLPVARDGKKRLILRGSSLAGDLIATARTLIKCLPDSITRDEKSSSVTPSSWDVSNAHLVGAEPALELRTGSAHRQDTRATGKSGLYDYEVIPPGTKWQFIVEVHHQRAEKDDASLLAHVLRECQLGRFWLGRKVSRGLGWLDLSECKVFELPATESAVDQWPTSKLGCADALVYLSGLAENDKCIHVSDLETYLKESKFTLKPQRAYLRWQGTICVGAYQPDENGLTYGLDALSVGAHGGFVADAESFGETHLINATDQPWQQYQENFSPDMSLTMVRRGDAWEPFIPGSALAGSLRHWLSHSARQGNQMVWDPVAQETYGSEDAAFDICTDPVATLIGYVLKGPQTSAQNSRLLVAECFLVEDSRCNWKAALGEKVALDEFTQGPFEGSKFNRLAILDAKFSFQLVLEIDLANDGDVHKLCQEKSKLIQQTLDAALGRHIGLGGGEFRAYGHVGFNVESTEFANAGDDWKAWTITNPATESVV